MELTSSVMYLMLLNSDGYNCPALSLLARGHSSSVFVSIALGEFVASISSSGDRVMVLIVANLTSCQCSDVVGGRYLLGGALWHDNEPDGRDLSLVHSLCLL